ncbi:hypothetical protein Syun_013099 [Stephania yunnanensis]|uniref:Uncharacterized protein n=1 Tax=Stephania yunnanensis TaxID=152371 RepID=A0AAP0K1G7_9MAGN
MPPRGTKECIEEVSAGRLRDSHHGSRDFVRWGSEDLRRPSGHSKQGGYQLSSEESSRGFAPSRAGKRSAEEESGFRPSALRRGNEKYYARGGRATKGSFSQRDWRGGHGSEQGRQHDVTVQTPVHEFDDSGSKATSRKRLVKKSGDRERTPDFGIEDEEPAFMRDEFASEPPSSQKRKKEDGFRKKEKKLKGIRMDPTVRGDNEGFIGDAPQLEKGHGTRESLDILLGKAVSYNPQAEVLWLRSAKRSGSHTCNPTLSEWRPKLALGTHVADSADLASAARDQVSGQLDVTTGGNLVT